MLHQLKDSPSAILSATTDCFGQPLEQSPTLRSLQTPPEAMQPFCAFVTAAATAIVEVIDRQYKDTAEPSDKFREETKSARTHNIDAEEVMGMLSAGVSRAPNATTEFLSCKIRAQLNYTANYLEEKEADIAEQLIKRSRRCSVQKSVMLRRSQKALLEEMARRQALKLKARDAKARRALEKRLENGEVSNLQSEFPNLDEARQESVRKLMNGDCVGCDISHVFDVDDKNVVYLGRLEKFLKKRKQPNMYRIAYWDPETGGSYEDAEDSDFKASSLAADLILEDLNL